MHLSLQLRIFLTLTTLILATSSQAKEMHALLVGVSEYPNLSKQLQLKGPRNDVMLALDVLSQRGFTAENIKVLADGVDGAALPTRDNILAELDHLAKTASKDDLVFLYFAGHGSQQPADRRTAEGSAEADGLYETFLPRDVGKWSGSVDRVENALIKTEIRDAVDRILAKGAFVWGVFDTCHSATLVRSGNAGVNYRYVSPEDLGIPQVEMKAAQQHALQTHPDLATTKPPMINTTPSEHAGGSVFFYATQTSEAAPEMVLPKGRDDGKYFGLFGYTVMQALETGIPMTYRQLTQYILARYDEMNEKQVTPLFSGTALDQPVLLQNAQRVQQWKIDQGSITVIQAGALSRLSEGAILAVMTDPLAKSEAAIGYLKLTQVGLNSSIAVPVEYHGKLAISSDAIPETSYARAVQSPPPYTLRASVDANGCDAPCTSKIVVDELRNSRLSVPGTRIQWVDYPAAGDVMLKLQPDRILLITPTTQGMDCTKSTAGICTQNGILISGSTIEGERESLHDKLAVSLHAIARTTDLLRIASSQEDKVRSDLKLEVKLKVVKKDNTVLPFEPRRINNLNAGDRIDVDLRNSGTTSVDVTMLYVDAHYGIKVLYPRGHGASNRLEPRASYSLGFATNGKTSGLERLLTIAVEAGKMQERADFSFLAQTPLSIGKNIRRDEIGDDARVLTDAGNTAYQTRQGNAGPHASGSKTSMQIYTMNVTN